MSDPLANSHLQDQPKEAVIEQCSYVIEHEELVGQVHFLLKSFTIPIAAMATRLVAASTAPPA